jgi:hypothetical protein
VTAGKWGIVGLAAIAAGICGAKALDVPFAASAPFVIGGTIALVHALRKWWPL